MAGAASRGRGIAGKLVGAVSLVSIVGDALAVYQTQQDQSKMNSEIAAGVQDTLKAFLKTKPTPEQLKTSLAGVEKGIRDIESNPLNVLVQGDALDKLRGMRTDLQRQIAKTEANTAQGRQIVAAVQAVGPSIGKAFNSGGIIGAIGGLIPYLQRIAIARTGVLLTTGPNKGRPSRAPLDPGDVNASAPTPGEKGRHLHGEGIKLTTTHRDNSNAATLHGRYGPTRSQAGAG